MHAAQRAQPNIQANKTQRRTIESRQTDPPQADAFTAESSQAGLRVFFNIMDAWKCDVATQMALLGLRSRSTYHGWKRGETGPLSIDTLERLSYIFGIYKALQILLPDQSADEWMRKPNTAPIFNGQSALDRLRSGRVADLFVVRQYLDAQRGGWN